MNEKKHLGKKAGFFIFVDMLVALMISMIFVMMYHTGLQNIYFLNQHITQLVDERNTVTEILTSKKHYVEANELEEDRTYEILPDVFVHIYHIEYDDLIKEKYGIKKVEFGIIEDRKGEQFVEDR